jgi:hypothetical protein
MRLCGRRTYNCSKRGFDFIRTTLIGVHFVQGLLVSKSHLFLSAHIRPVNMRPGRVKERRPFSDQDSFSGEIHSTARIYCRPGPENFHRQKSHVRAGKHEHGHMLFHIHIRVYRHVNICDVACIFESRDRRPHNRLQPSPFVQAAPHSHE